MAKLERDRFSRSFTASALVTTYLASVGLHLSVAAMPYGVTPVPSMRVP